MIPLVAAVFVLLTVYLIPAFVLIGLIALAAVFGRSSRRVFVLPSPPPRFLFVIPAHDEETSIAATVASCRGVDYDPDRFRVCVIADNCTDATARVAREAGADVTERSDDANRSKGHALEYFFGRTPELRPGGGVDAAVLVDADTVVDRGLLANFAASLARGDDWVQGYYTVRNPDVSWRTRLLTLSFALFNGSWLLGFDRLGLGATLKGNGMCFSARGLDRVPWRAYGLVEDLEFSWMLRVAGERIRFLPSAVVRGEMVSRGGPAAASQRRRWEAGRRALRGKFFRPLIASRALDPWRKLLAIGDLLVPPLVPLTLALAVALSIHPASMLLPGLRSTASILGIIHGIMIASLFLYGASPFLVLGLPARYILALMALPYYAMWKLVAASGRAPSGWVRTGREASSGRTEG